MSQLSDPKFIEKLNAHLAAGGVIAFPTDTVWGLGALPTADGAAALYETKNRPSDKRFIVMSNAVEHLAPFMCGYSDKAIELGRKYWPGALTVSGNPNPIFDSQRLLPRQTEPSEYKDTHPIFGSVRIPNHPIFLELCEKIPGHCLATTSANVSGWPTLKSADEIRNTFPDVIVIEDGDIPPAGLASTVIRVTGDTVEILRQGKIVL
ncbi:MAG: L-threonylcarbamoyladenylate synthase [Alphaproteobacteria bacterium]|nr:L-threonylcarbamoyladenylate synthase [Alphaproteobacteria bacterium]MCL2889993.1 L-threonylcarbamoyladenylate synthase [Alphaproteobacteria bacterium]